MAYWGIAISQRPNPLVGPFPGDVLKRGWEAVEKARAAPQKTERERAWIDALAAFYQDYATVAAADAHRQLRGRDGAIVGASSR